MVVEDFPNFAEWFLPHSGGAGGLGQFFLVVIAASILGVFAGYLVCAVRHGPGEGFFALAKVLFAAPVDIVNTSPRRTWAIAKLTIQDAIRKRILLAVFGIFAASLLVGGWFLDSQSDHPERVYLGFVFWGTQMLSLSLMFLLTAFSLPTDIADKTIFTIVTKPVRTTEIILGRVIGFVLIGSVLLGLMYSISYLFVVRGLDHRHTVDAADLVEEEGGAGDGARRLTGYTSLNSHHRHLLVVPPEGDPYTEVASGHSHPVTVVKKDDGTVSYELGPPEGLLEAKVPVYSERLYFLDRQGKPSPRGISTGDEFTYRSYIAGGTQATAIWRFKDIRKGKFPADHLPIEMTIAVFRTHKGDIEKGIRAQLTLKHPTLPRESEPFVFDTREFHTVRRNISPELNAVEVVEDEFGEKQLKQIKVNLFDDLCDENGQIEVRLRCPEPAQYLGVARGDLYLRASDSYFMTNFAKGYFSIWLQMIIVVAAGTMFSTFLSTSVSLLATISYCFLGFVVTFVESLWTGKTQGGGPIESLFRLVTQFNVVVELQNSNATLIMKAFDRVLLWFMLLATYMVPNLPEFDTSNYLRFGFNIQGDLVAIHLATAVGFVVSLTMVAYFFLKSRELAA